MIRKMHVLIVFCTPWKKYLHPHLQQTHLVPPSNCTHPWIDYIGNQEDFSVAFESSLKDNFLITFYVLFYFLTVGKNSNILIDQSLTGFGYEVGYLSFFKIQELSTPMQRRKANDKNIMYTYGYMVSHYQLLFFIRGDWARNIGHPIHQRLFDQKWYLYHFLVMRFLLQNASDSLCQHLLFYSNLFLPVFVKD